METKMGYRGTKSDLKKSVKAQRVDGSQWINKTIHLRYTLMDFERSYPVKIPSKQLKINNSYFSTFASSSSSISTSTSISTNATQKISVTPNILNPWFITGLIDAEGSFFTSIFKTNSYKLGWYLKTVFAIGLDKKDLSLLLELQQSFGGIGNIIINQKNDSVIYSVTKLEDLINIVIPHFEKYPLLTQKAADFILLKKIVKLVKNKEHLTIEGLQKIINIKASMNYGLSNLIKENFTNIIPIKRPVILTDNIPDPNWLFGFTTGEGNFDVRISPSKSVKIGHSVLLRFRLYQDERDLNLMKLIILYLGAGKIEKSKNNQVINIVIYKISDINNIVIPFFEKNNILGNKQLDYLDWCRVASIINERSHLTLEGLDLIRKIKSNMNRSRK